MQCKPAAGLWNPTLNPVCWNPNILIDFSIFAGCEFKVRVWEETLADYGSIFRLYRFVPRALPGLGTFQAATESEEEGWPELRAWPWNNVRAKTFGGLESNRLIGLQCRGGRRI